MTVSGTRIEPYVRLAGDAGLRAGLEAIFFEASAVKSFSGPVARSAFLERWLGRYLEHFPSAAFVAVDGAGRPVGYVVGCLEHPAVSGRFGDVPYFAAFAELTAAFPAHLHINVAAGHRGSGVGGSLIEALAAHAARRAVAGIHAVTALGVRNNGFYANCGFRLLGEAAVDGRMLAFFGRALAPP